MSQFKIEKVKQELEITLATGERLIGTVFLEPNARHHSGLQDPRELLNDAESFFPVSVGGGLVLVAKDQVRLVRYNFIRTTPAPTHTVEIRVTLADKSTVDGRIEIEPRSDAERLLDQLNRVDSRFLSVLAKDRGGQCLVNRRMIVGIQQR